MCKYSKSVIDFHNLAKCLFTNKSIYTIHGLQLQAYALIKECQTTANTINTSYDLQMHFRIWTFHFPLAYFVRILTTHDKFIFLIHFSLLFKLKKILLNFMPVFGFSMQYALKWVQTSLCLDQRFLRQHVDFDKQDIFCQLKPEVSMMNVNMNMKWSKWMAIQPVNDQKHVIKT